MIFAVLDSNVPILWICLLCLTLHICLFRMMLWNYLGLNVDVGKSMADSRTAGRESHAADVDSRGVGTSFTLSVHTNIIMIISSANYVNREK